MKTARCSVAPCLENQSMKDKIRVGLFGTNGHQILHKLKNHPDAELAAVAGFPVSTVEGLADTVEVYESLEDMLEDPEIDVVSLCSPIRSNQGADAVACLKAGKHVYAEKPGAHSEQELKVILQTAQETRKEFHEMADTIFHEPYWSVRKLVQSGKLGTVVQVYVQKSYPLRPWTRPQDEDTDGGLIRWVGIHGIRFLEHITGLRVVDVRVFQTHLGNKDPDKGLFTASSWAMTLENGGVATMCANYLNPKSFPTWGNETVRVFGTEGMVEVTDGGTHTHWYAPQEDMGSIDVSGSECKDFFDCYMTHLRHGEPMPMDLAEELHPLHVVLRAFEAAQTV